MGSKHKSHGKFGAGIILLAVQNAVKDSSFVHLSVLPSLNVILSRQADVWGRQECCHSFPRLAPADFLQGLRGHFWVYMHCWTNLWWGIRLCTIIRPDPEPKGWSVSFSHEVCGLLGEWQSSEQNWGSFGRGEGEEALYISSIVPMLGSRS